MHSEWSDRLNHWIRTLEKDLYWPLGAISVEGRRTFEEESLAQAMRGTFVPMQPGERWGETYEYLWLRGTIVLPEAAQGKRIVMDLPCGGESTLFVNGKSFGTYRASWVEHPHHFLEDNTLTRSGRAGDTYDVVMEAYAGHFYPEAPGMCGATGPVLPGDYQDPKAGQERAVLGNLTFGIWNEEAYQLLIDLCTLQQTAEHVDPESLRRVKIEQALKRATLLCDFEQEKEARVASYRAAREALQEVLSCQNGPTVPMYYAVGNAHLDLSWLWPVEETHRKTLRTFAAQLRHIEEYPSYRFIQSQPAAYAMVEAKDPDLFLRIQKAARGGQWIPEGAMWVEPDTNMSSGEALIRQVLYGKRYFREKFGIDSVVLWLPDSFGYSGALPQILRKTGVRYLVTQKIFWSYNEGERFPYHYFTWQGIDGSRIDTFLPTSYTYRTDPATLAETWKQRTQKEDLEAFLLPFGYGDGGGGPARDHIEYLLRETDLEGLPRTRMESPVRFFEDMEKQGGPKHTYVGELYFSAHRGVYTSQARVKRGNRRSEIALREAEAMAGFAMMLGLPDYVYPQETMEKAWKTLLFNQFHDILPGSSIARVYERAAQDHQYVQETAEAVMQAAADTFLDTGDTRAITVCNTLSFPREGLVRLPARFGSGARREDGSLVPVEKADDGVWAWVDVPPMGAVSLWPARRQVKEKPCASATWQGDCVCMDNGEVRAIISPRGEVLSFVDLFTGREFAKGPMNHLRAFKDVPRKFDAWDVDSTYREQEIVLDEPVTVEITQAEGLRAVVHVSRKVMHSHFAQDIVLEAKSRRLDFVTRVHWDEMHRLLKVAFPVDVYAENAAQEIQFGYVERPTHFSRPYDQDRFEVCNQRYSALYDHSHGAAVLNDCKYGISVHENEMALTLLRASASPVMRGDQGEHEFTYAFLGWDGDFSASPVVQEAYRLNVPLHVMQGGLGDMSLMELSEDNIFVDTLKPAEDGSGDLIVRLYEGRKADTVCRMECVDMVESVTLCDMLENPQENVPLSENGWLFLHFTPFEIKTLRLHLSTEGEQNK